MRLFSSFETSGDVLVLFSCKSLFFGLSFGSHGEDVFCFYGGGKMSRELCKRFNKINVRSRRITRIMHFKNLFNKKRLIFTPSYQWPEMEVGPISNVEGVMA